MSRAARKIGSVIATAGLVLWGAVGVTSPASADNGPHIESAAAATTSTVAVNNAEADGCAGCHRMHSAKGETNLLRYGTGTEESFCEGCHDGTGADTNTKNGTIASAGTNKMVALRGGGFQKAAIGADKAWRANTYASAVVTTDNLCAQTGSYRINKFNELATGSFYAKLAESTGKTKYCPVNYGGTVGDIGNYVPVAGNYSSYGSTGALGGTTVATSATTSTHSLGDNMTMWGSGASGASASVSLECTSCHNPHGNGNYRILRPVGAPIATSATGAGSVVGKLATVSAVDVYASTAAGASTQVINPDATQGLSTGQSVVYRVTTTGPHGFTPGMSVAVAVQGDTAGTTRLSGTVVATDTNWFDIPATLGIYKVKTTDGTPFTKYSEDGKDGYMLPGTWSDPTWTGWTWASTDRPVVDTGHNYGTEGPASGATALGVTLGETDVAVPSYAQTILAVASAGLSGTFTSDTGATLNKVDYFKFTTGASNGLVGGQKVTIAKFGATTGDFVISSASIVMGAASASSPYPSNFYILKSAFAGTPADVGADAGYYVVGIPDAKSVSDSGNGGVDRVSGVANYLKVYTTNNYLLPDDHYYGGTYATNANRGTGYTSGGTATYLRGGLKTGYIANVSQWCATCHTRYLASGGNTRNFKTRVGGDLVTNLDTTFTYRHSSVSVGEGSPNCVACHVAHGSNAVMDGNFSGNLSTPNAETSHTGADVAVDNNGSRLLRVGNRGLCLTCHGMND